MTETAAPSRRVLYMILGAIGAALVAVVILLVVVINQNNKAAEQAELTRINAICEKGFADPYGDDLDAMLACQDDLLSR